MKGHLIESEKVLEKKLVREVRKVAGWCIKLLPNFVSGIPDRMCLLPHGRIIFVEMKGTGEEPSPIQFYVHSRLRRIGFTVLVIDSTSGINELISGHLDGSIYKK